MARTKLTPAQLNTGAQQAYVATNETTSSTTYADLTTTTDTVTVTIGANGLALVVFSATTFSTQTYVSFAMSGANTLAASDIHASIAANTSRQGISELLTGLTPGSTTFKLKYRVASGTGNFLDRRIAVVPL